MNDTRFLAQTDGNFFLEHSVSGRTQILFVLDMPEENKLQEQNVDLPVTSFLSKDSCRRHAFASTTN